MKPLCIVILALTGALPACRPDGADSPADRAPPGQAANEAGDALLLAATRIGLPPPGITPADLPDPTSPGAQAVVRYCAQCHELPSPLMHSATDWPSVVRRMWLRMERLPAGLEVAVPTEGGRAATLAYLTANALKVSDVTLAAGPGRDDYIRICSRCHALPDPRVHSPQDWLTVYLRMEQNMERMNVQPATQDEGTRILTYLQAERPAR
jgi:hypothetical protein